jgi:NADPH:quinone reductase-like Zn-dependent oxidoreductase
VKAAIVKSAGAAPVYADFEDPVATDGEIVVDVTAAPLSQVTKMRAAGTHYSSAKTFPFVVGLDGVGRRPDGQRVYFVLPRAPFGSYGERAAVKSEYCVPLPDGIDDVTAAAIAIPAMSSWAPLTDRAKLTPGETVLVHGATGMSGRLAVQIARHLGARTIIATGRDPAVLKSLPDLGADVCISLTQDEAALAAAFDEQFRSGVDIVLDYVWGPSAGHLLDAAVKAGKPLRFVQIGSIGGAAIPLHAHTLRSFPLTLIGSGMGSIAFDPMLASIGEVFAATVANKFAVATKAVPLSHVETHWTHLDAKTRAVFMTGSRGG